ncbi:MAG: heparan-alpha-glucosaminide N-acetyltransferase domain-containing protein [Candidatus Bathyarchaeia archaeon]
MVSKPSGRLQFIDFARGLVMAIMAWDHVSGFWNRFHSRIGEGILGNRPAFISLKWFLSRYVSHYCAPTFVFLAGTVLAISTLRRAARGESQLSITRRLVTRGIILLFLMYFSVTPAFGSPSQYYFGVIACIGVCLIIFSVARLLPRTVILGVSLVTVLFHQYLDLSFIPAEPDWGWYLRVIIHEANSLRPPYTGRYSIIPWIGVMGLGWVFGTFLNGLSQEEVRGLKRPLLYTGLASTVAFFLVRWNNGFGNLLLREGTQIVDSTGRVWIFPQTTSEAIMDWMSVSKYPPSVAFLLWTLGGMCIMMYIGMRLQEQPGFKDGVSGVLLTYGRSPLFFYLAHLWLYKLKLPGQVKTPVLPMFPTFVMWFAGLTVLWWLCERYERIKRSRPNSILQYI